MGRGITERLAVVRLCSVILLTFPSHFPVTSHSIAPPFTIHSIITFTSRDRGTQALYTLVRLLGSRKGDH